MNTIKLNIRLLTEDGKPLPQGTEIHVLDEDPVQDDTLSRLSVGMDGRVEVLFSASDIRSADTPTEERPDLYIVVESGPYKGFRSTTLKDVAVIQFSSVTKTANTTHDLQDVRVYSG